MWRFGVGGGSRPCCSILWWVGLFSTENYYIFFIAFWILGHSSTEEILSYSSGPRKTMPFLISAFQQILWSKNVKNSSIFGITGLFFPIMKEINCICHHRWSSAVNIIWPFSTITKLTFHTKWNAHARLLCDLLHQTKRIKLIYSLDGKLFFFTFLVHHICMSMTRYFHIYTPNIIFNIGISPHLIFNNWVDAFAAHNGLITLIICKYGMPYSHQAQM